MKQQDLCHGMSKECRQLIIHPKETSFAPLLKCGVSHKPDGNILTGITPFPDHGKLTVLVEVDCQWAVDKRATQVPAHPNRPFQFTDSRIHYVIITSVCNSFLGVEIQHKRTIGYASVQN